jgi:hypothetical protein
MSAFVKFNSASLFVACCTGPPPRYDVKSALVAPKTAQGSNKQTTNQKGSAKSVRVSSGKLSKTSKH